MAAWRLCMDAKTAVLVDGKFYLKRFRKVDQKGISASPEDVARALSWAALAHLRKQGRRRNQLYRIFFYDCPPMDRVLHNPLSQRGYNYRKTDRAQFRLAIHEALRKQRKVALRLGRMAPHGSWHLKEDRLKALLREDTYTRLRRARSGAERHRCATGVARWRG